jgi:hypothetical protein
MRKLWKKPWLQRVGFCIKGQLGGASRHHEHTLKVSSVDIDVAKGSFESNPTKLRPAVDFGMPKMLDSSRTKKRRDRHEAFAHTHIHSYRRTNDSNPTVPSSTTDP